MSDKIIYVKRKPYTRGKVAKDNSIAAEDKYNIGGSLTESGAVYKGLSFIEERLLMPFIIGVPVEDVTFTKESNDYFIRMHKHVPLGGIKLNVSLEDDSKPLDVKNLPKVVEDYILWKYCSGYSACVDSIEGFNSSNTAIMYLFDEEVTIEKDNEKAKQKVKAIAEYSSISENPAVVKSILTILKGKTKDDKTSIVPKADYNSMSEAQRQTMLADIAIKEPSLFIETASDKTLETKAEVYELIDAGVIETVGNSYQFGGEEVGKSVEQVVGFVKAAANSKKYLHMKAKLESLLTVK